MRLIDADKYEEKLREMMPKFDEENSKACIEGQTIYFCIEALRSMQTIEKLPNDPLTEEELREMDGDKIYVHYIDGFYTNEDGAYFGKFEQLVRECNEKLTACELPLKYYGKTWQAYRRRPVEGMT